MFFFKGTLWYSQWYEKSNALSPLSWWTRSRQDGKPPFFPQCLGWPTPSKWNPPNWWTEKMVEKCQAFFIALKKSTKKHERWRKSHVCKVWVMLFSMAVGDTSKYVIHQKYLTGRDPSGKSGSISTWPFAPPKPPKSPRWCWRCIPFKLRMNVRKITS